MTERLMHSIPEAAELTGLGRTVIYRELAEGRIESVTVGRRRLVPHASLEDYVDRLRAEASEGGHVA